MLDISTAVDPASAAPDASRAEHSRAPLPPGPKGVDAIRWLLRFRHQEGPLEVLTEMGERYGDVALLNTPMQKLVILRGPDAVRHVLPIRTITASPVSTRCSTRSSATVS
jgi:hypothetical protein